MKHVPVTRKRRERREEGTTGYFRVPALLCVCVYCALGTLECFCVPYFCVPAGRVAEEERRETRTQLGLARGHPNTWYILVPGCLGAVRAVLVVKYSRGSHGGTQFYTTKEIDSHLYFMECVNSDKIWHDSSL